MKLEIAARKKMLSEITASQDIQESAEDLEVQADETIVISSRNATRRHYRQIRPKSVAELKAIIGVPDGVGVAGADNGDAPADARETVVTAKDYAAKSALHVFDKAARPARLARPLASARLIATNRLVAGVHVPEDERLENMQIAHDAMRAYVYGKSGFSSAHLPLIEKYLQLRDPIVFVPFFRDVTVFNGGTLSIAANTLALFANKIRLYGSGRIVCTGPKTLHCTSFEGYL